MPSRDVAWPDVIHVRGYFGQEAPTIGVVTEVTTSAGREIVAYRESASGVERWAYTHQIDRVERREESMNTAELELMIGKTALPVVVHYEHQPGETDVGIAEAIDVIRVELDGVDVIDELQEGHISKLRQQLEED